MACGSETDVRVQKSLAKITCIPWLQYSARIMGVQAARPPVFTFQSPSNFGAKSLSSSLIIGSKLSVASNN
jgi:hypothetical protein